MANGSFDFTNFAGTKPAVPAVGASFTITAPPKTDIYTFAAEKPPRYVYTAPTVCRRIPRDSFASVRATVSARWHGLFDQAGLVLTLPTKSNPNPDAHNSAAADTHPAWIKAGVEVNDGRLNVSVVARGPGGWADWSLAPQFGSQLDTVVPVTLQFGRHDNALLVWLVRTEEEGGAEQQVLIREVPWVFLDDATGTLGDDVLVGAYAAQPDPHDEGRTLEVTVSGLKIETVEEAS